MRNWPNGCFIEITENKYAIKLFIPCVVITHHTSVARK